MERNVTIHAADGNDGFLQNNGTDFSARGLGYLIAHQWGMLFVEREGEMCWLLELIHLPESLWKVECTRYSRASPLSRS